MRARSKGIGIEYTSADLTSLGEKLDSLDLTPSEAGLLDPILERAAGAEVEGFASGHGAAESPGRSGMGDHEAQGWKGVLGSKGNDLAGGFRRRLEVFKF